MTDISAGYAVITGAAGGMGAAIARAFAAEGRDLIVCDLDPSALEATARNLGAAASVETVAGDITAPDFPDRIIAALKGRKISALAHAAGVSPSMADGKRIFEINLRATMRLAEACLPHMAAGGAAVLIASNSGQLAARPFVDRVAHKVFKGKHPLALRFMLRNPGIAYSVSKRAVQLYAKHISGAFGRVGARVVSLSPGIIDTDMGRLEQKASPEMYKMVRVTPVGRMGGADEIASVVAFLASPAASYISGTDILVDGGTIAGIENWGGIMRLMRTPLDKLP